MAEKGWEGDRQLLGGGIAKAAIQMMKHSLADITSRPPRCGTLKIGDKESLALFREYNTYFCYGIAWGK